MYFCRCIAYYCVKCFGAVPIVMSEPGNCNLPNSKPFSAISRVFRPLVLNAFARLRLNLVVSIKTVDSVIRSPLPPTTRTPRGLSRTAFLGFGRALLNEPGNCVFAISQFSDILRTRFR